MRLWILVRGFFALALVLLFVSPTDACGRAKARRAARQCGPSAPAVQAPAAASAPAAACTGARCR